jgi:hypothetical protein
MFAQMVANLRKWPLARLHFPEGCTFWATRISELAAGKVLNEAKGLLRIAQ